MKIKDYLYQKKLHEPLAESKPTGMKFEDWALLDRQALGAVRLSLVKNVAYNVVNEKTTYGLLKALSNMYEKPSASNKVFLIRQLVNAKMNEGASVIDHVNEFNSILSRKTKARVESKTEAETEQNKIEITEDRSRPKKRIISVGQLTRKVPRRLPKTQQWKVTKGEMTLEEELRYTKSYIPTISNENYLPLKHHETLLQL
ncbi:hypothetical protein Tco_0742081 [Tanacetum coccineum]